MQEVCLLPCSWGSGRGGSGPDAGAAYSHREVGGAIALPPILRQFQDQNILVDWDRVQVEFVDPGVWAGTETAAALGLPDDGRDLIIHCQSPKNITSHQTAMRRQAEMMSQ